MMKRVFLAISVLAALVAALGLCACAKADETPAEPTGYVLDVEEELVVDGSAWGYAGTDPVEAAVYQYLAEEVSKDYAEAEVHIPLVQIFHEDFTNEDEVLVYGDFWIFNYNVEGDTLTNVSGGNHPGVMHVVKDGNGYKVSSMDVVADGAGWDESAREIFGEHYDDFIAVHNDEEARAENRKITVSDYVNLNGLSVTQFQDYVWDPVELYLQ